MNQKLTQQLRIDIKMLSDVGNQNRISCTPYNFTLKCKLNPKILSFKF